MKKTKARRSKKYLKKLKRFSPQFNISLALSVLIFLFLFSCINKNQDKQPSSETAGKDQNTELCSEIESIAAIKNNNTITSIPKTLPLKLEGTKIKSLIINFSHPVDLVDNGLTIYFNRCPKQTYIIYRDNLFFSNAGSPIKIEPEFTTQPLPQNKHPIPDTCYLRAQMPNPKSIDANINFYQINQLRVRLSSQPLLPTLEVVKTTLE